MFKWSKKLGALVGLIVFLMSHSFALAGEEMPYITEQAVSDTRAYKIYAKQEKNERAKMYYLINLVRYSKMQFYRNGRNMPGSYAARGFDFKMRKHGSEANTAEEWIERLGSFSNKTRERYRIIYPNGKTVYSNEAFKYELARLEAYEAELESKKEVTKNVIPAQAGIYGSPTKSFPPEDGSRLRFVADGDDNGYPFPGGM